MSDDAFGARLRMFRERSGKSRAVLGGLVGRSAEWVKAIETGRLQMPRVAMLLRLAETLGVADLADLIGEVPMPLGALSKGSDPSTPAVADALLAPAPDAVDSPDLPALVAQLDEGWRRWVTLGDQKRAVAPLLPGLITTARATVRALDGAERRRALVELSRTYLLAQSFFAYQPQAELVWLSLDRAQQAAYDADDPLAVAASARYAGEVHRGAGQPERAVDAALRAADLLDPGADVEQRARWGQLQLSAAIAEAAAGRAGDAWRRWDLADQAATALGEAYAHPWLRFGRAAVDAGGLTLDVKLCRPGEAIRRAGQIDLSRVVSPGHRAGRLLDLATAHTMRRDPVGAVHWLQRAARESAETVRFSLFARGALVELSARRSAVRDEARELATAIGL